MDSKAHPLGFCIAGRFSCPTTAWPRSSTRRHLAQGQTAAPAQAQHRPNRHAPWTGPSPKAVVRWLEDGLLRARRSYAVGPNRTRYITDNAREALHPRARQYVDVDRMLEG